MHKNNLIVIAIAFTMFIILGMPSGLLNVAWTSIQGDYEVTPDAIGILLLASTSGYLIASFVSGRLIARLTMPYALTLGMLVAAAGMVLGYGLAQSWWLLIAIVFLGGLGTGVIDSGMNLHFARYYSPMLMNWLHASFGLGAALGPIIMTLLLTQGQSWRLGYILAAAAYGLLGIAVLLTRRAWKSDTPLIETPEQPVEKEYSLWQSLTQPLVLLGVLLFFIYAGIEVAIPQMSYSLFTDGRGIDLTTAGTWASIYWATFTIGRIVFGFVADRVRLVPVLRACMLVSILGSLLIWQNSSETLNVIGIAIAGFALGPIFPFLISATPERLGTGHATNAIGFQVGAASLGIGALPGLAGLLAVTYNLEVIGPYLVVASVIMLVIYQLMGTRKLESPAPVTYSAETPELR
ncbi:MAG: MFS transporter [Anaerolineae bacterium]|nr:MFS transporter [Anaerolineae bacterium]